VILRWWHRLWDRYVLRPQARMDYYFAHRRHQLTDDPLERQRQLLLAQSSRDFMNSL